MADATSLAREIELAIAFDPDRRTDIGGIRAQVGGEAAGTSPHTETLGGWVRAVAFDPAGVRRVGTGDHP